MKVNMFPVEVKINHLILNHMELGSKISSNFHADGPVITMVLLITILVSVICYILVILYF